MTIAERAPRGALTGWALFDWAAQPFFTLVAGFVFAPYFVAVVVGDRVAGQALWGYATAAAAVAVAAGGPVVGAVADASGRRKPWIAACGAVFALACALLSFPNAGAAGSIAITLACFAVASVAIEFAVIFNNSMMPSLVPATRIGRLSGLGAALGNVGGIASIVVALMFLSASPETGLTLLGRPPVFGLDGHLREGERAIGIMAALWFVVFLVPLFLFTPDQPQRLPPLQAARRAFGDLLANLRGLRGNRNVALFLLANMIYTDGLVVLFSLGGILAAGILNWGAIQVGLFGILVMVCGVAGALAGGALADRFGAKPAILIGLLVLLGALSLLLTIYPDRVGPFAVAPPAPGRSMFASVAERAYLIAGAIIGLATGSLLASPRSMLVTLAPADKVGQFFGLYTFSGKATAFLGPLTAAMATQLFDSQRAAMVSVMIFLIVGGLLLCAVKPQRA